MPDIAMCPSTTCPKRTTCRRSPESGTKPNERRQAWMGFGEEGEPCESYWPVPTTTTPETDR